RLGVGAGGELLLHTKAGTLTQSRPVVYQQVGGERREVEGRYVLRRGAREVGFQLGAYDKRAPLVIDPVLIYSTYFLPGEKMAVDAAGGIYVVGTAEAVPVLFTPGAFQTERRGPNDAFVAKLDASGTELAYVTYLGGSQGGDAGGIDYGQDIAVDSTGHAYVAGVTYSTDFPTANAFQTAHGGVTDGFVTKLNPSGSALIYSSYLGGANDEWCKSIVVDAAGGAYLFGDTTSTDFPLKNALQPSKNGTTDFFLTKVAPAGSSLAYSTYLGGSGTETGFLGDIAVDAAGSLYLGGTSDSKDYPVTPGAFQPEAASPDNFFPPDAVVSKLSADGSALLYSTFLGGAGSEFVSALAVDAAGQAHVAGLTDSADFPTRNALQPESKDPNGDGFVSKLNASGTALIYSTYLSGTPPQCGLFGLNGVVICSGQSANGVAVDAAGNAHVTGYTTSKNFPAPVNALQASLGGGSDAYLIKLGPTGQALYSTYLGGSSNEYGADVYADAAGTAYVLGFTDSNDFPTVNPFRDNFARESNLSRDPFDTSLNSFVAKIKDAAPAPQTSRVRFESPSYSIDESGRSISINVTRAGDLSQAVEVDYATGDRTASERGDYTTARGTLTFAPGEEARSFSVSLTDDRTVEGDETLGLTLHNLRGPAVLEDPAAALVTVRDDDEHPSNGHPIDDSRFFVRQHYLDFLGREPDASGLDFWAGQIEACGADAACREERRELVSAAFFLSIEFQAAGFLVERLHRLAFQTNVRYETFIHDARGIGEGVVVGRGDWEQKLSANRRAYAAEFVARFAFRQRYAEDLTAARYVELLEENSGGSLSPSERAALVAGLEAGTETRAGVLLKIADDEDFRRREFDAAFVLMQYLGYLRRDPDDPPDGNLRGYNFWLAKLNAHGGDWRAAGMVRAFLNSFEYRDRFHEPLKEAAFGTPFTLKFRERAVVLPDKLRVQFIDLGHDSRCPRNVVCVTQGGINILLSATKPGGETARFVLRIEGQTPRPHTSNPPVSALGYKFRLLQLDPEPPHTTPGLVFEALLQIDRE
ncbi:MAG TPA: SBBP repeat-containing protein, partial [Pyrinomonadaceae bacterium]|nr:SBBP repeat-containing protein [Pyrinomonadaceae bacterium]